MNVLLSFALNWNWKREIRKMFRFYSFCSLYVLAINFNKISTYVEYDFMVIWLRLLIDSLFGRVRDDEKLNKKRLSDINHNGDLNWSIVHAFFHYRIYHKTSLSIIRSIYKVVIYSFIFLNRVETSSYCND